MWITTKEIELLGVPKRTIERKISSGDWASQEGKSEGRRGRPSKEVLLESLPVELQLKWVRLHEERASAVDEPASEPAESVAPDSDSRLARLTAALARFSPPQYTPAQRAAIERRAVEMGRLCDDLAKWMRTQRSISYHAPGAREAGKDRAYHQQLHTFCSQTVSADPTYTALYPSAKKKVAVSTLLRLLSQYQRDGLVAFLRERQTLSPEKDERFLEVPQEALNWLQANLKNYVNASITAYGENLLAWAKRNGVTLPFTDYRPGRPGTCYAWLYRWVKRVPNASLALARDGGRKFEARYAIITRNYDDLRPRVGWTMDWRTSDVPCWLPFNKSKNKLPALVREVVCSVFDLKARALFGYHIADRPSARGITLAYVDAITLSAWKQGAGFEMLCGMQRGAGGIEAFVLWDNGKDFRSQAVEGKEIAVGKIDLEDGLAGALQTYSVGLAVDAQIKVRHSKPYNAKSKTVETFHHYGIALWEKTVPGYCGKDATSKPHYYAAALRLHKAFERGDKPKPEDLRQLPPIWRETYERYKEQYGYGTPFLSQADWRAAFAAQMVKYNLTKHEKCKTERGEMSPIEYLNLYADTPHLMQETTIAGLLMEAKVVTVDADRLALTWYGEKHFYQEVASELSDGTALLRLPEKTKVEVRYNPDNIGRALVMTQGAQLCWVQSPELLGWNASRDDFKAANARKKQARKTAEELYTVTGESTDWRDVAEERLPKALPVAVNAGGEVYEAEDADGERQAKAPVTVMTRFDRKPADAPTRPAEVSHLRVVPPPALAAEDDFSDLKTFDSSDEDEPIQEWWEK